MIDSASRSIYYSACTLSDFFFDLFGVPIYHLAFEIFLLCCVLRLFLSKRYSLPQRELSKGEEEELINEWQPEPLVPSTVANPEALEAYSKNIIDGKPGKQIILRGRDCLNVASYNFLDMIGRADIEEAAIDTISKYGVGSCGPRGFYGTIDVHLDFEDKIAKFMNCEEAILYSYGFSTVASAIPAYAKRGDVIFCDEGVHFAVQKGLQASRAKLCWFRHNNMAHLTELLDAQAAEDARNPKKAKVTRRFLVVEGLYVNYGDVCPLPQLVDLKYKYKVRLFVDESYSFATLGSHGRGVTELFDIDISHIDLISSSLEASLASTGGFCVGTSYVVDHQRLSGHGYCFSASLPPLLCVAAHRALDVIEKQPVMFEQLKERSEALHAAVSDQLEGIPLTLGSLPFSPIKHVYLANESGDRKADMAALEGIVERCWERGLALAISRYLDNEEHKLPRCSIKISVNVNLTDNEISFVAETLRVATINMTNSKLHNGHTH